MNPSWKYLLLILALVTLASCSCRRAAKEYAYVFYESTGQNQFLLVDSKEMPFRFDEGSSDQMAVGSFNALSPRVLYPNSKAGRIILVGDYDAQTQLFRIEHWYLRVPFVEVTLQDRVQLSEEVEEIKRHSLERTDFVKQRGFDPKAPGFDPKKYEREEGH